MRSINADARVTVQSFDIEHEEYEHTEMSVEEALDFATDEGCPPAVDAAPVVHAHWIEYYTNIMCSHCHATYKDEIVGMYQDGVDHRRYVGLEHCPHCGSVMDGGDE